MKSNPINDNPFEYLSHHGTSFKCSRCDLADTIVVENVPINLDSDMNLASLLQDIAEMAGWHAVNIRPELNGFAGYDTLDFGFEKDEEADSGGFHRGELRVLAGVTGTGKSTAEGEPTSGSRIKAGEIGRAVGKFIIMWGKTVNRVAKVTGFDGQAGRVSYDYVSPGEGGTQLKNSYKCLCDPSQIIMVFDTAEEAQKSIEDGH